MDPTKSYYESTIIPAKLVDFGVSIADQSIVIMHTVHMHEANQMTLNLTRKEIDVQFMQDLGHHMRKFRFRLPTSLISHIYKVPDEATGQPTLIIPFNSPPRFFKQMSEGELLGDGRKHTSFSSNEKTWNEWNSWFRATDVMNEPNSKRLSRAPLLNHKDASLIDIGKSFYL